MKLFNHTPKHVCEWELVAVNDQYFTNYTDTGKKQHHNQRFYKCSCGKRHYTNNNEDRYTKHSGMDKARDNWIDAGVVPSNSYHPTQDTNYVKADTLDREQIDPVLAYQKTLQDMVDSLGVVINRDFDMETRYPKLKEAADEYHRQLDKYRNFDALKETD